MKIGVVGAGGRMGRMLLRQVLETEGCTLVGATERPGGAELGADAGTLAGLGPAGVTVTDDPVPMFAEADAVLDFTSPESTVRHAILAAQGRATLVVGTTGMDEHQTRALHRAASHTRIVQSANFSVGVTLLAALVEKVARTLGPDFDIEVLEMHHRRKVDAPSGTALLLGRSAAAGRGVDDDAFRLSREGLTGARPRGEIGFATLRGGDVIGDHRVLFAGDGEMVELAHRASGRHIYAQGAVRAALWAQGRKPGYYTMRDVLGIE